jgi:predicted O-methyltransferase YrrM
MKNTRDFLSLKAIDRYPALKDVLYSRLAPAFHCKTHLTTTELVTLYRLAKRRINAMEIGSYLGASSCAIAAGINSTKGRVLCIDTWENDAMSEGAMDTFNVFKSNTMRFSKSIVPVRGWSHMVKDYVCGLTHSLDLLFIDGDHSYEGAKQDWDTYKGLLLEGSIVIFHDVGWATGVQRVIDEEVRPVVATEGSLPNMWWGTLSKKP